MISSLLVVNPNSRPSCDLILAKIGNKHGENILEDIHNSNRLNRNHSNSVLQTLRIPKNLKEINKMVPKSNYKMRILRYYIIIINLTIQCSA